MANMKEREGGEEFSNARTPSQSIPLGSETAGQSSIRGVTWNPNDGARRAVQRNEDLLRQAHLREVDDMNSTPQGVRIKRLEDQMNAICRDIEQIIDTQRRQENG